MNVEGAEVHGLSVSKKPSPKIDRDLREGKYLCTFTLRRKIRVEWDLTSCYSDQGKICFLWKIKKRTKLLQFIKFWKQGLKTRMSQICISLSFVSSKRTSTSYKNPVRQVGVVWSLPYLVQEVTWLTFVIHWVGSAG